MLKSTAWWTVAPSEATTLWPTDFSSCTSWSACAVGERGCGALRNGSRKMPPLTSRFTLNDPKWVQTLSPRRPFHSPWPKTTGQLQTPAWMDLQAAPGGAGYHSLGKTAKPESLTHPRGQLTMSWENGDEERDSTKGTLGRMANPPHLLGNSAQLGLGGCRVLGT